MIPNYDIPNDLIPSDPRFGCGPTLIPNETVQKLVDHGPHLLGTSHRSKAVKDLVKEIQQGLVNYFNLPSGYEVVLGNGGATFLFDAIGLGLVQKKSTHFTCGEFSNKWFKSHKLIPWIEAEEVAAEYGTGITAENRSDADMICVTLNETSTGVMVDSLPDVDEETILAVDATSGGGQVPCDLSKVDLFFFAPQKVFASEGGTFVAIMSPKAQKRALEINDSDRYIPGIMNWKTAMDNAEKNQTYNTTCISALFYLNEQIKRMNAVGYEGVIAEGNKRADFIYQWATNHPKLSCYISDQKYRSNAVATIDVDESFDVTPFIKELEQRQLVYGIGSYRKLGRNQFRIALFQAISFDDIVKLTKIIDLALK
jgi:phosphoserine aminotransferase